jgi:hypothetical protein
MLSIRQRTWYSLTWPRVRVVIVSMARYGSNQIHHPDSRSTLLREKHNGEVALSAGLVPSWVSSPPPASFPSSDIRETARPRHDCPDRRGERLVGQFILLVTGWNTYLLMYPWMQTNRPPPLRPLDLPADSEFPKLHSAHPRPPRTIFAVRQPCGISHDR